MSINRWLLLAGLLAIGACGSNPNAYCALGAESVNPDTEEILCKPDPGTPVIGASQQGDDLSDASVQW